MMLPKLLVALTLGAALASAASSDSLAGRWEATTTIRGLTIPFRVDFTGDGATFNGLLFNGDVAISPTSAKFADGSVTLTFEQLPLTITATLKDGQLEGRMIGRSTDAAGSPFVAMRYVASSAPVGG